MSKKSKKKKYYYFHSKMKYQYVFLLQFILILTSNSILDALKTGKILHISDIHLDPTGLMCDSPSSEVRDVFLRQRGIEWLKVERPRLQSLTNGSFGQFGCDTFPSLLQSLSDYLKNLTLTEGIELDGVILSGDSVAHGTTSVSLKLKAMSMVNQALVDALGPDVPIYLTIGNNDVLPDYNATCDDPLYSQIAQDGFPDRIPSDQLSQWNKMASYVVENPFGPGSGKLISFNTILLAQWNPNFAADADPCGSLSWLRSLLNDQTTPLWLMGHIPPAVDSYDNSMLYAAQFQEVFPIMSIVDSISYGFFGHLHTDEFRHFQALTLPPVLFLQGSVSPIYGQNPSFRILDYQIDGSALTILDYQQYYFNLTLANQLGLPVWAPSYRFTTTYQLPDCSPASYSTLWDRLTLDYSVYLTWQANVYSLSGNPPPPPPQSSAEYLYLCAQTTQNTSLQSRCSQSLIP